MAKKPSIELPDLPEKRTALLYVRIKERNRDFLVKQAKERGSTLTEVVDTILDQVQGG